MTKRVGWIVGILALLLAGCEEKDATVKVETSPVGYLKTYEKDGFTVVVTLNRLEMTTVDLLEMTLEFSVEAPANEPREVELRFRRGALRSSELLR